MYYRPRWCCSLCSVTYGERVPLMLSLYMLVFYCLKISVFHTYLSLNIQLYVDGVGDGGGEEGHGHEDQQHGWPCHVELCVCLWCVGVYQLCYQLANFHKQQRSLLDKQTRSGSRILVLFRVMLILMLILPIRIAAVNKRGREKVLRIENAPTCFVLQIPIIYKFSNFSEGIGKPL